MEARHGQSSGARHGEARHGRQGKAQTNVGGKAQLEAADVRWGQGMVGGEAWTVVGGQGAVGDFEISFVCRSDDGIFGQGEVRSQVLSLCT